MKSFLRFIIITAVLAALVTTFTFAEKFTSKVSSTTWELDDSTGTLTVTGKGAMSRNMKFINFHAANVKHIVIDEKITSIPSSAFAKCAAEDVVLPEGLTSIAAFAFYRCEKLKTVTIPPKVFFLGSSAFSGCKSLESVSLPDSLRIFGNTVFKNCSALTTVNFPDGLIDVGADAFGGTAIINDPANLANEKNPESPGLYIGNCLFRAGETNGAFVVKEGTRVIAAEAFSDATSVTSVSLPSSLRYIGRRAFAKCAKIRTVILPEGVKTVYDNAFDGCSSLKTLGLPESVRDIGAHLLDNCKDIREISYAGAIDDKYALNIGPDNETLTRAPWYYGKDDPLDSAYKGYANFKPAFEYGDKLFTDVEQDQWYYNNVKLAYEYGLIKGKTATEFKPAGNITLAETVALACRIHSAFAGDGADFTQGSPWYRVYIDYAVQRGILEKDDPEVKYNTAATRAQFAVIMAKALPRRALRTLNYVPPVSIPDVRGFEDHADAVYTLYEAGIVTGADAKGTFKPSNKITRSEAAAILTRMVDESVRQKITLTRAAEDAAVRTK
ncbi:MAG: leucine-rich repeat protein [Clostridia bacterium]|nr:leucine-rich repeat protein [Clostridia bacterium]